MDKTCYVVHDHRVHSITVSSRSHWTCSEECKHLAWVPAENGLAGSEDLVCKLFDLKLKLHFLPTGGPMMTAHPKRCNLCVFGEER